MKLYDGGRAPNPRRTRIFLAEKDIELPIEQVDLGAMQHKSAAYAAVNPLMRVPALVLDDGTVITESIAICRYFEALHPDPPLFGRGALEMAHIEMWNRRLELHLLFPVSHVFRNSHPAMKEMEVPQVPAWAEANKPRIREFVALLDARVEASPVHCRRCILGRRHYRPRRRGLHEAGEARGAGRTHQSQALARRCFRAAERVGLSMRLTIVGSGDAFGSGGRFNTCFFARDRRRARSWSIAEPRRWSRSRRMASIPTASTASCFRICTATISARFRSSCSMPSSLPSASGRS